MQRTEKNSFSLKKLSLLADNTSQGWAKRNFIISDLQRHPEHRACELTALLKPLPKDEPVCLNPILTLYPQIKPLSSYWLLPANPGWLSSCVGSLFFLLLQNIFSLFLLLLAFLNQMFETFLGQGASRWAPAASDVHPERRLITAWQALTLCWYFC